MELRFNIKSKLKELSFYFTTQALLIITPIVYIPLISSYLSPAEFGKTSLFLMCLSFSSQLFYGPISNGINRFYFQAIQGGKSESFFNSIERIIVRISGIVLLIIFLLYEFFIILEDFTFFELILIYLTIIFFGIYVIFNGILAVQRQRSKQMFLEIGVNLTKLLSLLFIFKFIISSNISVIYSSLSSLLVAVGLLFFLLDYKFIGTKISSYYSNFFYSKIIKFAIPFVLWAPFLTGYFMSDRFLIKKFFSLNDLGNYSIQYQLTFSSMQLLTSLISGFLMPILLKENHLNKSFEKKHLILIYFSLFFILLGLAVGLFLYQYGESLIHLFLKKEYSISPLYLFIMTLSGSIYGASQILAIKQTLKNTNTKLLYCNILLSILGFTINYFSIQSYGIQGLVYSLLIISTLWYISLLFLFKIQ